MGIGASTQRKRKHPEDLKKDSRKIVCVESYLLFLLPTTARAWLKIKNVFIHNSYSLYSFSSIFMQQTGSLVARGLSVVYDHTARRTRTGIRHLKHIDFHGEFPVWEVRNGLKSYKYEENNLKSNGVYNMFSGLRRVSRTCSQKKCIQMRLIVKTPPKNEWFSEWLFTSRHERAGRHSKSNDINGQLSDRCTVLWDNLTSCCCPLKGYFTSK